MRTINKIVHMKMNLFLLVLFAASMLLNSCGDKAEGTVEAAVNTHEEESTQDVKFLELSAEKFKAADIILGSIEEKNMSEVLKVSGILDVPPQNLISINAPYGGFIKQTDLLEGTKVKKGQVIVILSNAEYIQMQQDYLENSGRLEFLEKEYQRQKELQKENVTAAKTFQRAESDYKSMFAVVKGSEAKLALLGIDKNKVREGSITSDIVITAPINGYVTKVNANIGKFVNPQDVIFEIVDTEHLHVELTVFEQDISKIKEGQKIRFTLANDPSLELTASVHLIGRSFDETRSVRIHGHLDKEDPHLLPGMYVNAVIELGNEKVKAVPKESVVLSDGKEFIFIRNKDCQEHPECSAHERCESSENCPEHPDCEAHEKCVEKPCKVHSQCAAHEKESKSDSSTRQAKEDEYYTFTKVEVKTGIADENFVELKLTEPIPLDAKVVTKGAFSLLSQTKMGGAMDACGH
jgi:cobalt-zinc-cadmium efflux system membrane fusion protein